MLLLLHQLQEVTVEITLKFTSYIVSTKDQTDFEIKLLDTNTEISVHSLTDGTAPLIINQERKYAGEETSLFYVKGTTDSILQIVFERA